MAESPWAAPALRSGWSWHRVTDVPGAGNWYELQLKADPVAVLCQPTP